MKYIEPVISKNYSRKRKEQVMLTKKTIILSSVTIVTLILIYFISCHSKVRHFCLYDSRQEKLGLVIKKFSREFDLDKNQVQLLKNIENEIQKKRMVWKEERKDSFNMLITELASEKMNEQALHQLWDKHVQHMNEIRPIVITKLVEFHNTLTPVQREKLVDKITDIYNKRDHN
jgi:Spy/CpxP family protein refolding chaperone